MARKTSTRACAFAQVPTTGFPLSRHCKVELWTSGLKLILLKLGKPTVIPLSYLVIWEQQAVAIFWISTYFWQGLLQATGYPMALCFGGVLYCRRRISCKSSRHFVHSISRLTIHIGRYHFKHRSKQMVLAGVCLQIFSSGSDQIHLKDDLLSIFTIDRKANVSLHFLVWHNQCPRR